MTENPVPRPVEQAVVEQETVHNLDHPVDPVPTSTVVSRTTEVRAPDRGFNALGVLGFLIALVALFFYNIYAIPGIVAVILSSIALSQISHEGSGGRGFASWGLILGLLAIVWVVLQYLGVVETDGMLYNFLVNAFGFTA